MIAQFIVRSWISTLSLGLASAGLASASVDDPISTVASDRFAFRENGHDFEIPCRANVEIGVGDDSITHLVVMVHGIDRATYYHDIMMSTMDLGGVRSGMAVVSPQFLNGADLRRHGLYDNEAMPYWDANGWVVGHDSLMTDAHPRRPLVSSFVAVDSILNQAVEIYPELECITVAGFSAGGQFVNRYAAGSPVHDDIEARGIVIRHIVSAPSSYLYFCENRPIQFNPIRFGSIRRTPHADCGNFNQYRLGLESLNQYMSQAGRTRIPPRYASRRVYYLTGEKDDATAAHNLSVTCGSMLQGAHRLERAHAYHAYLAYRFGEDIYDRHLFATVPNTAHNSRRVFVSREGVEALLGDWGMTSTAAASGTAVLLPESRDWTSTDGRVIRATLVWVEGGSVRLRRDDDLVFYVDLLLLSNDDREYVAEFNGTPYDRR